MKRVLFLSLCIIPLMQAQAIYIIVHGTWCTPFNWHMPGGDFFEAIQKSAKKQNAYVGFLQWQGKNSHAARLQGAQLLVNLIKIHNPHDEITLVAHSHGGNVALLASQLLHHSGYTINRLFLLGTPIDVKKYAPNMSTIKTVYNLFSFGDMVQTVGGLYAKELPPAPGCHNIRIVIDEKHPNHCALHHHMIGSLIGMSDFWYNLDESKEQVLVFGTGKNPLFTLDPDRKKQRDRIKLLLLLYNDPLRKINSRGFLPSDQEHH